MGDINLTETDAERARRNQQKKGISYQLRRQTMDRWNARKRRDELHAVVDYGMSVFYRDIER